MPDAPVPRIPALPAFEPWADDARAAAARLRVVPAFVPTREAVEAAAEDDARDPDGLDPARGAIFGLTVMVAVWLVLGLLAWHGWHAGWFVGRPG